VYYIGGSLIKRVNKKIKEDREKSKGKLYKNCKNLRAYYEFKNCFIINKKLYYK